MASVGLLQNLNRDFSPVPKQRGSSKEPQTKRIMASDSDKHIYTQLKETIGKICVVFLMGAILLLWVGSLISSAIDRKNGIQQVNVRDYGIRAVVFLKDIKEGESFGFGSSPSEKKADFILKEIREDGITVLTVPFGRVEDIPLKGIGKKYGVFKYRGISIRLTASPNKVVRAKIIDWSRGTA